MYTVRVKCAPVPRQRVHPILQWRKPGHNPGVCYEYHTEFAHSRKPAYARPPFCGGSNPSQSAIAMGAYRFISLGIIKCPAGGILLYLAVQVIFYLWLMKDLRQRHNQNSQNHKKNREKQGIFAKKRYFWQLLHNLD